MDKQQLAESMAEFLGWVRDKRFKVWRDSRKVVMPLPEEYFFPCQENEFNPEGFIPVWDKLTEDKNNVVQVAITEGGHGGPNCSLLKQPMEQRDSTGRDWFSENCEDRYTAFYQAIHEMRGKG